MPLNTPENLWKPEYLLDVGSMDEQHKHFFKILDVLSRVIGEAGRDVIKNAHLYSIVWEVRRYSQKHFHDEETLLQKYGYQGFADQCSEHDKFLRYILEYINDKIKIYELVPGGAISDLNLRLMQELLEYTQQWWADHILKKDALYVDLIKSNKRVKHI